MVLVSIGHNIVVCNFEGFVTDDLKGGKASTGMELVARDKNTRPTLLVNLVTNLTCQHLMDQFYLQRLSVTRALQRLFPISKTTFWWTS